MNSKQIKIGMMAVALLLAGTGVSGARAGGADALTRTVHEDVASATEALAPEWETLSTDAAESEEQNERWMLQRLRLRIQGKVGVEVPWLAGLELIPEVELVWQRPAPEGWTSYKP